jgi:hypothetical protein
MSTVKPLYGTPAAIGITTTALASDVNLLAGRQSDQVDNESSVLAMDAILGGTVATTGTPTTNTVIEVWLWGSWDSGTTRTSAAGTADANLSMPSVGAKYLMALAVVINQTDTTARTYSFGPLSVAKAFGLEVPPDRWGVFVVHNTGTTLGATALTYTPVQYQNVA